MTSSKVSPMLEIHRYRLSRHVVIRPFETGFIIESLLSGRSMTIADGSLLQLLLSFAQPVLLGGLLDKVSAHARPVVLSFLSQCHADCLLSRIADDGTAEEDLESLKHWEFHDLLFHVHSRRGRTKSVVGATSRLRGRVSPEPAVKPRSSLTPIRLTVPSLRHSATKDMTLTHALEARRSVHSTIPIDLSTLSEFLYRTCRTTSIVDSVEWGSLVRKLYPSGGGLHSLEVYVATANCPDLQPGVYHYCSDAHELDHKSDFNSDVKELLQEAQSGTGSLQGYPPILLIISSRFRRVMWKYQALAYHLVLQEVGALYQTMYLVATAMGLAPSAIGAGDSDRFSRVVGTDYYAETSVGEFILGGPPENEAVAILA